MFNPKVSVVICCYNVEKEIVRSLLSLQSQTYKDFEIIIVDDGSKDYTYKVISNFSDPRIILHKNKANMGLTKSLIYAIDKLAKGEFIVRLDAGDVCHPNRIEKQLSFFKENHGYVVVGSKGVAVRDIDGDILGIQRHPVDDAGIRTDMFEYARSAFVHSSVMFRRDAYEKVGGYNAIFFVAQDFDLWLRMLQIGKGANLPGIWVDYYISDGISFRKKTIQNAMGKVAWECAHLRKKYGNDAADEYLITKINEIGSYQAHLKQKNRTLEEACFRVAFLHGNKAAMYKWLKKMRKKQVTLNILSFVFPLVPSFVITLFSKGSLKLMKAFNIGPFGRCHGSLGAAR